MTNVAPFSPCRGVAVEKSDAGVIWLTATLADGSIVAKALFNHEAKALAEALIGLAEVDG